MPDPVDPIKFRPGRHEPRGEFPAHAEAFGTQREPLPGAVAAERARARLLAWRKAHNDRN